MEDQTEKKVMGFCDIMKIPRAAFGLMMQYNSYFLIAYNTPILSKHIIEMKYSASFTAVALVGSAIAFLANMPAVLYFQARFERRGLLFLGLTI